MDGKSARIGLPEPPESRGKTSKIMSIHALAHVSLQSLGAVAFRGADVVRFLQGQLSQDIERTSASSSLMAGYHNAQGRVIALLRLVRLNETELLALLPRELAPVCVQRLAKFVLRAKVTISDESASWQVRGILGEAAADWPRARNAQRIEGDTTIVCVGESPPRWLAIEPRRPDFPATAGSEQLWHAQDIAAGEPQVFAATSELFVSQMLNLDVLGAIAFDKGCYTGQEIIARAHYRGRMKRRMQRFRTATSSDLAQGTRGRLADGRAFIVVQSARVATDTEFLAVAPPPGVGQGGEDSTQQLDAPSGASIDAVQLPMPYDPMS
jgi:tRNA-modifying protein YgfZ